MSMSGLPVTVHGADSNKKSPGIYATPGRNASRYHPNSCASLSCVRHSLHITRARVTDYHAPALPLCCSGVKFTLLLRHCVTGSILIPYLEKALSRQLFLSVSSVCGYCAPSSHFFHQILRFTHLNTADAKHQAKILNNISRPKVTETYRHPPAKLFEYITA